MSKHRRRRPAGDEAPVGAPARHAEPAAPDGTESVTRQFVIFVSGDEVFAVDMQPVLEIVRVPETVRVPLAPPSLDGLANLRGRVLPIVNLRRAMGFAERAHDDVSRALVIDLGQPLGFVVDRVVSVVSVDPGRIEPVDTIQATVHTELLSGIITDVGGHAMVMILDFERLVAREIAAIAAVGRDPSAAGAGAIAVDDTAEDDQASDERQLVSFDVAGQEYAIGIEHVQEIVPVPERIVAVPRTDEHVLGLMTLRERVLPLVSLRRMFALAAGEADASSRVVVVSLGTAAVGIVVDGVNEVLRVPLAAVDAMPGLFTRDGRLKELSQLCRLDGGKRLVSIIDTTNLFRHDAIQEALRTMTQDAATADTGADDAHDDDEQVVVFRLGQEEFGVPIDSVQEIVRVPEELTRVPKAPDFVEGVINLRGAVLPVVDLRRRLGLPSIERADGQRIMVFLLGTTCTGFIVDSVAEVLKIHQSAIEPAPHLSGEQRRLLTRMANLAKANRMVQLLAPAELIDRDDLAGLAGLAA